jgi:CheY-like chemotaxis protein
LVRENPGEFDLVITHLVMPEMNGLDVASQLRAMRPDLPIILVCGYCVSVEVEPGWMKALVSCHRKPVRCEFPGASAL